jgi:flagellin-like protein
MDKFKIYNRKGLSPVIASVLMIALVMAATAIIWASINTLLESQIDDAPCVGNFDKVKIEKRYTCYDSTGEYLRLAIAIGDVDVDKLLVSVATSSESHSFEIEKEGTVIPYVANFNSGGYGNDTIILPGKNGGRTYRFKPSSSLTDLDIIRIAPTIGDKQCETSDTLDTIENCAFLEN